MLATTFAATLQLRSFSETGATVRDVAETLRARQRDWLQRVLSERGIKPTPLARELGIAATTLTRKLNDPDDTAILSDLIIKRIADHLRVPAPNFMDDRPSAVSGFSESEAEPFDMTLAAGATHSLFGTLLASSKTITPWRLSSRALEYVGYMPGDILLVDPNVDPREGDVVCAQLYDWADFAKTRTVFRVYTPPFLVAAGPGNEFLAPSLIDRNVGVKGVVVSSIRERRAGTAAA